jgi:predicted DNA-binding transcriptional regulator AlpA
MSIENPFETLLTRINKLEFLLTRISDKLESSNSNEISFEDDLGDIDFASSITGLATATIYSKVSKSEIPYMKRGKKLYFSKQELIHWIKDGKKKTLSDLKLDVDTLVSNLNRT